MAQLVPSNRDSAQPSPARPARPRLVIENLDETGNDTPMFTICIVAASTGPASGRLEA